ncbi:hypothetical protein [Natronoglycomyces albus]|uniref:Uncharacterized protein n=1 Tax=Natronoglycomyces albus TaxID=2811108 RepID=A0A895XP83_9ACTN|nr:hypothetical protein [Natronoglycomyces albus]QSB05353.1 hypothetical protein JQS30_16660 [Natronoglycomyces albus]
MSLIDALASSIGANVDAVRGCVCEVAGTKAALEEVATQLEALSAAGKAAQAQVLVDECDQVMAALTSIATGLEAERARAEALKTTPGGGPSAAAAPEYEVRTGLERKPTPLDAAPPHLKAPVAKIGDPVKPVESAPPESAASRLRRMGRKSVEGADDFREYLQEVTTPALEYESKFDPWGTSVRTETHHVTTVQAPVTSQSIDVPDIIGTATMMTALLIDGASRFTKRGNEKHE